MQPRENSIAVDRRRSRRVRRRFLVRTIDPRMRRREGCSRAYVVFVTKDRWIRHESQLQRYDIGITECTFATSRRPCSLNIYLSDERFR